MKKLLLVFAIAAFVACNDSGNTEETPAADSPKTETAPPPAVTDTATHPVDTTKVDTTVKK